MAIKHSITLSTTEPNNEVGVIKIRQADEQTQTLEVQITENGVPKSYQGLDVYFCAKLGQRAGLGIIEQKLKPEEMTNPVEGKLSYTIRAEDWQILGRQKGYFSFRKMNLDGKVVSQFTTRDFTFNVIPSVFSIGINQLSSDGGIYIWTIEEMKRLYEEYIASGKSDWSEFVESSREVLESIDPGGVLMGKIDDIVNQKIMFGNGDITDFLSMDAQNIVLSGDSMSFNLQDWQLPSVDNSADKNYPGLMSWAHVLRDTIIRNDAYFKNAESVDYEVVSSFNDTIYGMSQEKYLMPFNNDNLSIRLKRDSVESSIKIKYKHNNTANKAVLHLNKHRSLEACIFDIYVDDVLKVSNIDVYGNPDFYKGFEMLDVSIDFPGDNKERVISLKNFRSPEGVENTTNIFRVILNGLGTKKQNIALTGEGGVTSEWFLSNLQERVLKYSPRFVALILGANDIYKDVDVETYKLNMTNIVNQIRGQYPQCQILLMTSPSMGHANTPDSKTIAYNLALRRIAYDKQCYFVDLLELFKQMHTSYWRYDNVHLTKMGSGILGKNIINLLMPGNIVDAKWFDTTYYLPYKHVIKGEKLALLNGWLSVEGYPPLQYTKNGKSVRIFGNIKSGVTTPTTDLCLLPSAIRLSNLRVFGALNLNAADDVSTGALLLSANGYLRTSYGIKNVNLSIDIQYELD